MKEIQKLNQLTESHGALRPGKGLVSGVIALSLAILCFLGVLAFHFPRVPHDAPTCGSRTTLR